MQTRILAGVIAMTACLAACAGKPAAIALSTGEVEALARNFYGQLAAYDFAGMRASSTAEFEIIENNGTQAMRMNRASFEKGLAPAQQAGVVLKFELTEFNTTVTPEAAYTTYIETGPDGAQYYAGMTLRYWGDKWLVDRLFTTPKPQEAAAPVAAPETAAPPAQ